jgi:hypothetical protein
MHVFFPASPIGRFFLVMMLESLGIVKVSDVQRDKHSEEI